MEIKLEAVRWHMSDEVRERIEKKLEKLDFAKESLVHCFVSVKKEHHRYEFECRLHFRWKSTAILKEHGYDIRSTFDALLEKIVSKTKKEIEKVRK